MEEDVGIDSRYLVCWGSGEFGQHSHSHSEDVDIYQGTVPIFNTPDREDQVRQVVCGASHTIAVTNANKLYVWGNGNSGQLGCGGADTLWEPQEVDLGGSVDSKPYSIAEISCGGRHTVLLMADGTVVGFGNNNYGQLGCRETGHETDNLWTPCLLDFFPLPVKQVVCGDKHTLSLLVDGQVMCMGSNHYGQAGCGDKEEATLPRLVKLEEPIRTIAAGANHNLALSECGTLYIWGYRKACYGMASDDILIPEVVRVTDPVHQVAAGSTHSVLVTGDVYTWGHGPDGQLGHGEDIVSLSQPTVLLEGSIEGCVRAVTCGESISAAVTENGDVYLWGRNSHTIKTSLPSSHPVFSPTCVTRGRNLCVKSISCGAWHAAATITTDLMKISVDEIETLPPLICDKATSTSPMLIQDNLEDPVGESISTHKESDFKLEDTAIDKDDTVHNHQSTAATSEGKIVNWTQPQRVVLPKLEPVQAQLESIEMDLHNSTKSPVKVYKKLSDIQTSETEATDSDLPPKSNFRYPNYRPQIYRSRTVFTDPFPQTVDVSKSTATKFTLPREDTSICNKTVGFVPLEDLNDYNNNIMPDADNWLHRQNSSIKSGYTNSSHFPRRRLRFSSGKKHLGLSRYNTCMDLKQASPHSTASSFSSTYSTKPHVQKSSVTHEPINSLSTSIGSKPNQNGKCSDKDYTDSYASMIHNSEATFPSVFPKNVRRNTYIYRREKTIHIPKLKPIERRIHKLDNMKSSYWNSKLRAGLHEERASPMRTNLVETLPTDGVSKLNKAMMSRQQSFILYSNDSRN